MTILALSFASYLFALWKRPLLYLGLVLQVAYIFSRGSELGRLPLVGPHDTPVLKTIWFECHVVLAFMSYALFGITAVFGGIYLKDQQSVVEGLGYRAALIGYCLFTLSMIFGGI